jgi:hypothetical protein
LYCGHLYEARGNYARIRVVTEHIRGGFASGERTRRRAAKRWSGPGLAVCYRVSGPASVGVTVSVTVLAFGMMIQAMR